METMISFLLFMFLLLSVILYLPLQFSIKRIRKTGFKIYPLMGILPELVKNRHRFLEWNAEMLSYCPTNTVVHRFYGKAHDVITANPSNVEHMVKTNFDNYPKGERVTSPFVDLFGQGLFNSDGDVWKVHRKTTSYGINAKLFRNFIMESVVVDVETRLVRFLERASVTGQILDLQNVLERFGFDNACKLAFDVELGSLEGDGSAAGLQFKRAYERSSRISVIRLMYLSPFLWKLKRFFKLGSERRLKESITTVHRFADNIIRSRIDGTMRDNGDDFLSQLIGNDISGQSPEFLRDMILTFILATRDTVSSALTWFFWFVYSRSGIKLNILKELESIRVRNGKNIGESYSLDELRDMHYLHAAISETMRLYPPIPIESRTCLKDDVLPDGTFVRKDSTLSYNAYAMGRMESIWGKNCHEFRPERWLENGIFRPESPYLYPIFNAGPRMCLGKDVAFIQMKYIAAAVIERFELNIQKDKCPELLLCLSLRMKGGLPVTVGVKKN
ncbi:Cytochrome P450, E-class, group I [Trema orientale]|uniref:Cytochrome P450, E-class, group I n=1 Tax=Trema orientale TaxID=63057 RepID=A0A2P5DX01_TREOI|nr:Cytochrome P450, E-class, group I [Trema orientale]